MLRAWRGWGKVGVDVQDVRIAILRLLAIAGVGAALGIAARVVDPQLGIVLSRSIGWGIAVLSLVVLATAIRATAQQFSNEPISDGQEGGAFASKRLIACSLVCYVAGAPLALGLYLAGQLPWTGVAIYVAPMAVAFVIGRSNRNMAARRERG